MKTLAVWLVVALGAGSLACSDDAAAPCPPAGDAGDASIAVKDAEAIDSQVPDAAGDASAILDSSSPSDSSSPADVGAPVAASVAYTGSSATSGGSQNNGALNIGREFHVTSAGIRIRDLGIWDEGANGLVAAHTVTLFSVDKVGAGGVATAVPGGSVVVPAGTIAPFEEGFRFAALSKPLTLAQGDYAVIAYSFTRNDPYGDGGAIPLASRGVGDATFDPYELTAAASPAFPKGGDGTNHTSASFRYETPAPAYLKIMPFGDSITDGYGGSKGGYRGFLAALLASHNMPFQFVGSATDGNGTLAVDQVHHEGHSGFVIDSGTSGRGGLSDNLNAWCGPGGSHPDLILLMIGTNDVDLNYDNANAGARFDAFLSRIANKTSGLLPNVRVIVAKITMINDATEDARAQAYNTAIAAVVAQHKSAGEDISLVDMHGALAAADFFDKLHPNDTGYSKMAQVWMDGILAP